MTARSHQALLGGGGGGCSCSASLVTGDRTASITCSKSAAFNNGGAASVLVNGNATADSTNAINNGTGAAASGEYVKFQFAASTKITQARLKGENFSHGDWKWQGSNDDSAYTDIGTSFTVTPSVAGQDQTQLNGNTSGYLYYRLLGVSGNFTANRWWAEYDFTQCAC